MAPQIRRLPADIDRFVGRRIELVEIKRLLTVTRLLTLTGIGGVGKTRLAVRVARDLQRTFRDGVALVELADLRDPELLATTIGAGLGLRDQSARWSAETLVDHIRDKTMLIVLDNCEHLTSACAALIEVLLRYCTELRVLATSREPLELAGECVFGVSALPVPDPEARIVPAQLSQYDGVTFFLDRADAAVPGFAITDENHAAVARLCHRLDGLPLAMELAAVRLRVLSVDEVLSRLDDRFRLLGTSNRNTVERQQTLRSCMDWSFDLCTVAEQRMWRRLTVFHGSFDLDAVEWICADDDLLGHEVFDVVAGLVGKSILQRESTSVATSFRMLETVRQYGQAKLREALEEDVFRRRHQHWHLNLVEQLADEWISPRQAEWLARLRRNHANLRAALEFCATTASEAAIGLRLVTGSEPYWEVFGLLPEARHWLSRLLELVERDAPERCRALRLDAWFATMQGDFEAAEIALDLAEKLAAELDDPLATAYVQQTTGMLDALRGGELSGISLLADALDRFRGAHDTAGEVSTLLLLGMTAEFAGAKEEAVDWLDRCLAITESKGESHWRAYALWMLGIHELWDGRPGRAGELEARVLADSREADLAAVARAVEGLGFVAARHHQYDRSAVLLGAADRIFDEIGVSTAALPALHAYRSEVDESLRAAMGERNFHSRYEKGRALPRHEALDLAHADGAVRTVSEPVPGGCRTALTVRELEIAELVAEGRSNRDIANDLIISKRTAEGHVEKILSKLGFSNRAQIAAWITELRLQN
ncbi:LuxR C-terminal-related transcriptional regulator [Nocardia sp. NPDC059240]|uniref:LuxR C-terminal-related transcriptional regulator n=1 Tax=Nocardia sp. NPDC059240 TaxID=3346786 RepID=UPI0036B3C57A